MSFLVDPPLLVGAGAAIEAFAPDDDIARVAAAATLAIFYGTSASLYVEAPWTEWLWKLCRAESGRDWMINSNVTSFNWQQPRAAHHVAAVATFALYPTFLRVGRRIVRRHLTAS